MLHLSNWVCKPICWKLIPGWMAGRALSARSPNPSAMAMGEICFHPLCSAMPSLSLLQNPKSSFLYNLEAVLRVFVEIHNLTTGVAKNDHWIRHSLRASRRGIFLHATNFGRRETFRQAGHQVLQPQFTKRNNLLQAKKMEKPWKPKKIAEFSTLYLREWFVNLGRSWNRVAYFSFSMRRFRIL